MHNRSCCLLRQPVLHQFGSCAKVVPGNTASDSFVESTFHPIIADLKLLSLVFYEIVNYDFSNIFKINSRQRSILIR